MRPPEFTGGNYFATDDTALTDCQASMRPPEFTGGNWLEWGRYPTLEAALQ